MTGFVGFMFYRLGPHRDLHSFPTRRSSDLLLPFQLLRLSLATPSRWTPLALSVFLEGDAKIGERFSRNAETELVCRLLLEKKNGWIQLSSNPLPMPVPRP